MYRITSCWFRRCWFHLVAGSAVTVVGTAAALFSGDGSAAGSSSCVGTDGATSTASRLVFSGLPSEVSSSPAVVVLKNLRILLVLATALSSRRFFSRCCAAPEAYKRVCLSNSRPTSTVFPHYNGVYKNLNKNAHSRAD